MKKLTASLVLVVTLIISVYLIAQRKVDLTTNPPTVQYPGDLKYKFIHVFADTITMVYIPDVTQNVYLKMTPGLQIHENIGLTVAGDSITIINYGDYWSDLMVSYFGGVNDIYRFAIFKNGVLAKYITFNGDGAANPYSFLLRYYFHGLVAGDDLSFRVTNIVDGDDPTITEMSYYVYKIPEEGPF